VERFTALKGIGPWTAHYVAMRALKHPDAFPESDLVLCQVAGAPGPALKPRALGELARVWRPYRSYAVMHLWRMAGDLAKRARAPLVAR
jgi:AraC family transcriptional regulator of adaptative response / DNA-3-methyladenine glycosylase II